MQFLIAIYFFKIGITIGNYDQEVDELIELLDLEAKKDQLINIINKPKSLSLPNRLTLFQLIKYCIEIRTVPKKVAIYAFSQFCTDQKEKDCLLFLASKEGSKLYDDFILKKHFNFLDLLKCFKTCKLDLKSFLVHSINLVPRYYSVIEQHSCEVKKSNQLIDWIYKVKIAFNVTLLPSIYNRTNTQLLGVFTGRT